MKIDTSVGKGPDTRPTHVLFIRRLICRNPTVRVGLAWPLGRKRFPFFFAGPDKSVIESTIVMTSYH